MADEQWLEENNSNKWKEWLKWKHQLPLVVPPARDNLLGELERLVEKIAQRAELVQHSKKKKSDANAAHIAATELEGSL
jgi:hypothetical protein